MWLSLLLFLLLLAVTMRQASQGLFSALIMVVLAICCAGTALGTYEWVAAHWLAPYWKPSYALPIALGATFGLPLVILHVLFAQLVNRTGLLSAWVDRIGAGICGFVTAMITVGILALCLQMIPFDNGRVLGFAPIPVADPQNPERAAAVASLSDGQERGLFFSPGRFVVNLASVLSSGVFSGDRLFSDDNPDLVQTIAWVGATKSVVSRFAPPHSISVTGTDVVGDLYKVKPGDPKGDKTPTYDREQAGEGFEFHMVRVRLLDPARDEQKSHFFTLRQFRLVGHVGRDGVQQQYHAIAIQESDGADGPIRYIQSRFVKRLGQWVPVVDTVYSPLAGNEIGVVFELPTGFVPEFIEYKREARAPLSFVNGAQEGHVSGTPTRRRRSRQPAANTETVAVAPPSKPTKAPSTTGRATRRSRAPRAATEPPETKRKPRRRGGRVRGITSKPGQSKFSAELPVALNAYQRFQDVEITRGALVSGHIIAELGEQEGGTAPPLRTFFVPPEKRLLQLNSVRLHARSGLGRALSFAVVTIQNYFVQDQHGRQYKMVGKYAIANVRGKKVFEAEYFSGPVGSIGGIGKFQRINEKNLKPSDQYTLLFLVDPGARIVSFSTGGAATRKDDLRDDNLVAPK